MTDVLCYHDGEKGDADGYVGGIIALLLILY